MATAKKTAAKAAPKTAPKKEAGKGLQKWDEQLAKYATEAAATEANAGSGLKSFSLKSGVLSFDDVAMPNNEMAVIVLDHVLENTYYVEAYDPENVTPPDAYALGRDEMTMTWHPDSIPEYAGQLCKDSDINQFGSAEKGKGKACRNMRRLLMIPAGSFNKQGELTLIDDEEHFKTVQPAFMKIPPTSITGWALYVKQLAGALRRPPFAVVTKIKVVPDAKSQFKVTFEAIEDVSEDLIETIISRHEEATQLIEQPYNMGGGDEEDDKPARSKTKAKPNARGAAAAKGKTKPTARKKY